jgi:amino-acid N-acetyltransferase
VRALAVAEGYQRTGLGRDLVNACRREALDMGIKRMFALTFQPGFFEKLGFQRITKEQLPHKVWSDCIKCPLFPNCDETAIILDLTAEMPARAKADRKE